MAKTGEIVSWSGALDCHFLVTPHVKSPRLGLEDPLFLWMGMLLA